jgi:tryptophanyl-tRNA synthetase
VDTGEAIVALLEPIQTEFARLRNDETELNVILKSGADKARAQARNTLEKVKTAMGLL